MKYPNLWYGKPRRSRRGGCHPYDIPAYLLGHLAVDEEYQDEGLGEFLLFRAIARSKRANIPFRVLLLHAHEDVVGFYEDYDFVVSESTGGYPKLMFMDLAKISDETGGNY
ncbi:MAG: GNAT family N-acetyltransferase [Halobacteriaceae archaeon]